MVHTTLQCRTMDNNISHGQTSGAFEMWIYRRMPKISWTDKISNQEVLRRASTSRQLIKTIQQRVLRFFGHLIRRNNIHRVLLEGKINGKRERGRPRESWVNNIIKWTGLKYPECYKNCTG